MGLWERLHKDDVTDAGAPPPPQTVGAAVDLAQAEQAAGRIEIWGRPGRCPECGGVGYLDRVDIVDRIQYEHCTECFHKWSVAESETVKVR